MAEKCTAVLLAAGAGRRMGGDTAKQYMLLGEKPVIWYGLQAFERSRAVDEVILVVGAGEIPYARKEIVEKYGFGKVKRVIEGGAERYLSVAKALAVLEEEKADGECAEYVLIQDGARPFLSEKLITDTLAAAKEYKACCAAVPVKDTIKISDEDGFAADTPDRKHLWAVQTPQTFEKNLILRAYRLLGEREGELKKKNIRITDDAMVVEQMLKHPVKLVEASYENIKLTTPGDMIIAESILAAADREVQT